LRAAAVADIPVVVVSERVASSLSDTVTPQGVVAVVRALPVDPATVLAPARLVAVLDGVSDPGNAGTAIRTADAAGADAVVLTRGSVDAYNGKCIRAAAGSTFTLPILSGLDPAEVLDLLSAASVQSVATVVDADDDIDALVDRGDLARPTAWVFGSEAHGLEPLVAARADRQVRIPMYGGAESLNLAAAVAICLYASARAHRSRQP
jgi:TrmH family RNA methyltransferase